MSDLVLQGLVLAAAVVVLARAEPAINRMGRATPHRLAAAFVLLAVGAVAQILAILAGHVPALPEALLTVGVAALLACERRLRVLCRERSTAS